MKFDVVLKQLKLNIPILFLSEILLNEGNNCCFTDSVKNYNVGLYLHVYEWI